MNNVFRILDLSKLEEMGFKKEDYDYVYREKVDGAMRTLFTVYAGSQYLRYSKTSYVCTTQLKCIYEWTKKNYILWEE